MAGLFPPLDSAFAFGKGCYSPNYLEKLAYFTQMIAGFPGAHAVLQRMLPVKMTLRQVWEQARRVGQDLVSRREAEVRAMLEGRPPEPAPNAPDVLVIAADGGRFQDRTRPVGDRWCEYKAAVVYRVTRGETVRDGKRDDPQPAPHWRYGVGAEGFKRVEIEGQKVYRDPKPETKSFTATTETVDRFPLYVELEAKRRGLLQANAVCFVGDGGDFVWRTAREALADRRSGKARVYEVLDLIHAGEHLAEAAKAAFGVTAEGVAWLNARFATLWRGDAEELLKQLEAKAAELAPRPGPEKSAARTVWNARAYFEEHRERIRYDVFRRLGLPLTSAHMESGIKQTNQRVKGSEKQWLLSNAEAMLALRCLALSEDERWDGYFNLLRTGQITLPTRQAPTGKCAVAATPARRSSSSAQPTSSRISPSHPKKTPVKMP